MRPEIFISVSGSRRTAVAMSVKRGTSRLFVYSPPPPVGFDGVPEKVPIGQLLCWLQVDTPGNAQPPLRLRLTRKMHLNSRFGTRLRRFRRAADFAWN